MAGRTGTYDTITKMWSDVIYMPCTPDNNFEPELPKEGTDFFFFFFSYYSNWGKNKKN